MQAVETAEFYMLDFIIIKIH